MTPTATSMGDTRAEEARLADALNQIPEQVTALSDHVESLARALDGTSQFESALRAAYDHGLALWRAATEAVQRNVMKDDRPLYWGRLQMLRRIRQQHFAFDLSDEQRQRLLVAFEDASRGRTSANFTQRHSKRILVSGFDPFGFSKAEAENSVVDLSASNPSGAAALELSNIVILSQGVAAEIQSAIFPVRFEDFDLGVVETFFRPYFENQVVDMIITISRGRKEFDLERFTGRRRSSVSCDNAKRSLLDADPVSAIPFYAGAPLDGPEFLENTLPINSLLTVQNPYKVNDNRRVTFLNGEGEPEIMDAGSQAELVDKIALAASGGGFLSNEISYRTHRLRDQFGGKLPVGHIHVPTPDTPLHQNPELIALQTTPSDLQTNQALIVAQVKELVKAALFSL